MVYTVLYFIDFVSSIFWGFDFMNDAQVTIAELQKKVIQFIDERDWQQFHTAKNMSMAMAAEVAELMELFLWCESSDSAKMLENKREQVENELADVAYWLLNFCHRANIDLTKAIENKLILTAKNYPIEKCKGKALKYTEL